MEVFFCHVPGDPERHEMAKQCWDRWKQVSDIELARIEPDGDDPVKFQRERRIIAEHEAKGKYYVLADDDCLISSGFNPRFSEMAMDMYAMFGIVSAMPKNATINPWTPEGYKPIDDEVLMEHHSVGGIRVIRRGCIKEWPEQTGPGYDAEHCKAMRDAGYRVGYFKTLTMTHLGENKSTVWNQPLVIQ